MAEDNPFEDLASDIEPLPADRPHYVAARPHPLRRAVIFLAVTTTVLALVVVPVLSLAFDVNPFSNPDVWREYQFPDQAGHGCSLYYTGRVYRWDAKNLAAHFADMKDFHTDGGATILFDKEGDKYLVVFFVEFGKFHERRAEQEAYYRELARTISRRILGGEPVAVELCMRQIEIRPGKVVRTPIARIE